MYSKDVRHAQNSDISKVTIFGPFSGHRQTYVPEPIKETVRYFPF
jgi:hypothetical protein